ncbi:MAG: proline dehydrogenase family protein, partial [Planctomycetota bacterium]|nr:proline dehydrogenase family protein [Planctomycetota bacterium]
MALFGRLRPAPPSPSPVVARHGSDGTDDAAIVAIGTDILHRSRTAQRGVLSSAFWSNKLMSWSMKDEPFKVQLFRFVDAYPMLKTPQQVHEHLSDYMSQPGVKTPPGFELGMRASGLFKGLMNWGVEGQITGMAQKFIAGTDAVTALPKLQALWTSGMAFSVDLLGEACVSDEEALQYRTKYLDLIQQLPDAVAQWPANARLEQDHLGAIPRTNVSIKISSLYARTDPIDTAGSIRGLLAALTPILDAAKQRGVLVNFDMEQFALKDLTLDLFMRACEQSDFTAGIAMQAYLRSGEDDARRIIEWAKRTGRVVTVRLVKGAYWDYETIHAEQQGWRCPVWGAKHETDACFERMARLFIDATPRRAGEGGVKLALGSHNARSIASALAYLDAQGLPRESIELQMLHGMADELKSAVSQLGLRLREYVPIGEMIPGMAYLVRRLLENTSNESWLKAGFLDHADAGKLLADPAKAGAATEVGARLESNPSKHALSLAHPQVGDGAPFFTTPARDFSRREVRESFALAVERSRLPIVTITATEADADRAIAAASNAFPSWRDRPWVERSEILIRASSEIRARRDELSAIIIKEAGKPWREA